MAENYTFTLHQATSDPFWNVTSINISINDGPNVVHSVNTLGSTNISISSSDFVSGTNTLKISNHSTIPGSGLYIFDLLPKWRCSQSPYLLAMRAFTITFSPSICLFTICM